MIMPNIKDAWKEHQEKKLKYDTYFLNRCAEAAAMSYCNKLQVGAVAVRDNRTILDGWNGTIPGQPNCCEEQVDCNCVEGVTSTMRPCTKCIDGKVAKTKPSVIHAERNIIFYAARKGIALEGATMYISHAPCIGCAQAMAAAGIVRVVFGEYYRDTEGIDFLKKIKIKVIKVDL